MAESGLTSTANLFLALGDTTRLRLLNLMKDREVCVSSFIQILGQSQPLVSRHLAYLRSAGVVEARRDGKWMHYSIGTGLDANTLLLMTELFRWMENQPLLREERSAYLQTLGVAEAPIRRRSSPLVSRQRQVQGEPEPTLQYENEEEPEVQTQQFTATVHHNELEDFLL